MIFNLFYNMYIFRADGNARIGVGHLMRCLTIADAMLSDIDVKDICFVCADEQSADIVKERGYEAYVLNTDYRDMDKELCGWQELNISDAVIMVDSYFVTDSYLEGLKTYGKVIYMDDMQKKAYPVDGVINYNVFADPEKYYLLYGNEVFYMVGGAYIPVREQFLAKKSVLRDSVSNVFITTGGGDMENIAGQIFKKLAADNHTVHFHVISGVYNPNYEVLKQLETKHSNLHIYHNVKNMAELMMKCDVAITAGGSTIYELAALGIPFICFSYAENQEQLVQYIGKRDIAGYAGSYEKDSAAMFDNMQRSFSLLCESHALREMYSLKETELVDGKGAQRIARILQDIYKSIEISR